jgi:DNA-binding NarL/FixJ family response regulator
MNALDRSVDGPVQVALVAAYPAVRAGLRALLAGEERIEVVAEAGLLRDLAPAPAVRPDVVVLDLDVDSDWGAPDELLMLPPETGFILLGPASGDAGLIEPLGDRPWAYLLKEASGAELARAIEAVAGGLVVVQPPLARRLLAPAAEHDLVVTDDGSLTTREHEVLQLVAEGLPNKTIARRLGISEHTVKFHITSILTKLDASSRTDAVRLGARRGLIVL